MMDGPALWEKSKELIPGGGSLFSKRSETLLPKNWPAYFEKTKGCEVWDISGKKYKDIGLMGVGTNSLGYSNREIDASVMQVIQSGNMSTLNCPEEPKLAETLVSMHPFAQMVKFARSGGEANAIAVRIARAASGRDGVLVCGYHGWHDWYLAASLSTGSNLDTHLMPGLLSAGVPAELTNTVHSFEFNDIQRVRQVIKEFDIGVIKMEVRRNFEPEAGFLEEVRRLATDNGIVLIFDECTSGFRSCFGGMHKIYEVEPDIAVFGKAMGNGYSITAVIGKREVMESAKSTFISSTFWTERIGPAAAIKTLEIMEREKSWEWLCHIGDYYKANLKKMASLHNLPVTISGFPAIQSYVIDSTNWLKYKTYITQEMLKRGYLAPPLFYACTAHTEAVIDEFFDCLDVVFQNIRHFELGSRSVDSELDGPICQAGFKRLN